MSRDITLKRILDGGIVAVVRSDTSTSLVKVVEALGEEVLPRQKSRSPCPTPSM